MTGGTEENQESLIQNSRRLGRDSNRAHTDFVTATPTRSALLLLLPQPTIMICSVLQIWWLQQIAASTESETGSLSLQSVVGLTL
jgi:hypothetical protein